MLFATQAQGFAFYYFNEKLGSTLFNENSGWIKVSENYPRETPVRIAIFHSRFQRGCLVGSWGTDVYSPVDGSQFGRLPPNGELRAVEVSLGPSLIEREKSIAVAFELHPEEWAQGSPGQLRHGCGQKENRLAGGWALCKHCTYSLGHLSKSEHKTWPRGTWVAQ